MNFKIYFYFIGVSLLLPLWLYLFSKKDKRKDMLMIGILSGIVFTIIEHLYAKLDYWNPVFIFPNFPFEDFYYGFIFGGISAELYEVLSKKRNSTRKIYPQRSNLLLVFLIITAFSFWFFVNNLEINSIVAHIVPPLIVGLIIANLRKDLLLPSLINGLLIMTLSFFMFQILLLIYPEIFTNHWMLENLSNIYFLRIPLEEYLFAFAVGFGAANVYELLYGYGLVKKKN